MDLEEKSRIRIEVAAALTVHPRQPTQNLGLTVAVAVVADSYGVSEEAGGPAEVAGALIGDVVVATDLLLGCHGAWRGAAHDAVGAVGLVGHTGVGSRTHNIGA